MLNSSNEHKADVNMGWEMQERKRRWWTTGCVKELCVCDRIVCEGVVCVCDNVVCLCV